MIWELPVNFTETCSRHLTEGTEGKTLRCVDYVQMQRPSGLYEYQYQTMKVDKYGIMSVIVNESSQTAMHVTMYKSVISDAT